MPGNAAQAINVGGGVDRLLEGFHILAELSNADLVIAELPSGRFIDCSPSAHGRLGYSRDEFLALRPEQLQADPDHDRDWVAEQMAAILRDGGGTLTTRHRCKDGTVLDVTVRHSVCELNRCKVLVSVVTDRTETEQITRELKATTRLFDDSERLSGIGSWCYQFGDERMRWSAQTYRICQLDAARTPPSMDAYASLVHPDDRTQWRRDFFMAVDRGTLFENCHRLHLPQGQQKMVRARGMTSYDSRGNPTVVIGTLEDITHQVELQRSIEQIRCIDPLTTLPNKLASLQHLQQVLRGRTYNSTLAIFSIDIDRFQELNDNFGPEVGDQLLVALAERLRQIVEPDDWLARLSSDEFLVLRNRGVISLGEAIKAGRLLQSQLQAGPALIPELPINPSVCVGISTFPEHGDTAQQLIQSANTALMEAKHQGHGQLRAYSTALSHQIRDRMQLDTELNRALESDQLRLLVQPQAHKSGQIVGGEVLLRWTNQRGIQVPPSQFIPVAEQSGMIFPISCWVLDQTLGQIASWHRLGLTVPTLAINISTRLFDGGDRHLVHQLLDALEEHALSPQHLELEITETALIANPLQTREQLRALADQGFRIAIDDFGTGYSSLDLLRTLPVHKLKIDRAFTQMITAAPEDQAIVQATITLALGLGMQCIAEGVETEEQRATLEGFGCELYQGYLCGKPMAWETFSELLQAPAPSTASGPPVLGAGTALALERQLEPVAMPLRSGASSFEQLEVLRHSLDVSPDAYFLLQASYGAMGAILDFVVLEANQAACHQLQQERETVIGQRISTLLPNLQGSGLLDQCLECMRSGAALELNDFAYGQHENSEDLRVYDLRGYASGNLLTLTWRDVTSRSRSVRSLADAAALYQLLAENLVEVIVLLGTDQRVRWVSPSLQGMTNWKPEQWLGQSFSDLFASASGTPDPVRLEQWLAGHGHVRQGRLRMVDPRGGWCWVDLNLRRLQGNSLRASDQAHGVGLSADALEQGYVLTLQTADEQVMNERRLHRQANTDELTGLRNRSNIFGWLKQRIDRDPQQLQPIALLFCDFDNFKTINDTHGHAVGDAVLQGVAKRLASGIRDQDLAGRIGGDEFLVVLDGVRSAADSLHVANKLRLLAAEPIDIGELRITPTLSIGVALHAKGEDSDLLLRRADRAMYAAKDQGRNSVIAL